MILFALRVPFGRPGLQVYPYSPFIALRFAAALPPMLAAAAVCLALARVARLRAFAARNPALLVALLAAALGLWTHWAPPVAARQHYFNLSSPSHEGAFLYEAAIAPSVREYLAAYPARLELTPAQLWGTRILSNPPGATILACGADRILSGAPLLARWLVQMHEPDIDPTSGLGHDFARCTLLAWLFTVSWIASAPFLFATARHWLDPPAAAVLMLVCFFNPSTVCFSPGKDPAQLFTVAAMIWGWSAGLRPDRWWMATVSGAALMVGLCFGLIHAWVALVLLAATAWMYARPATLRPALPRVVAAATAGAVAVLVLLWVVWRWNALASLYAVGRSYLRVQPLIAEWPWYWQLAKPPAFALFAGGGLWILARQAVHSPLVDDASRLGRALVVGTALAALYGCWQTTLETPRLLVAFVPVFGLGLALAGPTLRRPSVENIRSLLVIAALQIIATCLQWCVFDVRESEMRILTGRLLD